MDRCRCNGNRSGWRVDGLNALGVVPFERIHALYERGVDVFALSCCEAPDGDVDGIPVAILEAMARGVATVTTSVGGIPELIRHGENGLLVPPDQPVAFADALKTLRDDKPFRNRLGQNARCHVLETRSVRKHVQRLTQHFRSLTHEDGSETQKTPS